MVISMNDVVNLKVSAGVAAGVAAELEKTRAATAEAAAPPAVNPMEVMEKAFGMVERLQGGGGQLALPAPPPPPPPPQSNGLPPGWQYVPSTGGTGYYWNKETNQTT